MKHVQRGDVTMVMDRRLERRIEPPASVCAGAECPNTHGGDEILLFKSLQTCEL